MDSEIFGGIIPKLPVIFLTANDLDQDVLKGFDFGADDYITKLFNVQILKRQVEAVLHRVSVSSKKMEDCYDDGYLDRTQLQTLDMPAG